MKKKLFLWIVISCLLLHVHSQVSNPFEAYFREAYQRNQTIPEGLLEAVAFTNTRMRHLRPSNDDFSCQDLPAYYGVMGLVEDGKGYFQNNLLTVAELSGFSLEEIKSDPRINILAYAAAYVALQRSTRNLTRSLEAQGPVIYSLSEIPDDDSDHNRFARDQQFYGILKEMEQPHSESSDRSADFIDYQKIFGPERMKTLTAPSLEIRTNRPRNNLVPNSTDRTTILCTASMKDSDYEPALFSAASRSNYTSRNGEKVQYITIHTVQGSYAGAISWFRNPNAKVSTHYVIRASDGQVTQMVCEGDQAFHVRTDNPTTIGIEHEGYTQDGLVWYTPEMYRASAALTRYLCDKYDINPQQIYAGPGNKSTSVLSNECYKVKGHQHFKDNDHTDPGLNWDWDLYYRLVNDPVTPERVIAAEGRIAHLDYKELERKAYLVRSESNKPLSLRFTTFDLEGSKNTPFDYIDIYDGVDHRGIYLGRFTGNVNPGTLIANSGAAYLEFRSDCKVNKKGWELTYSTVAANPNCKSPENPSVVDIFGMGATLQWEAGRDASSYNVRVRRRNLDDTWQTFTTDKKFVTLTGLGMNGLYEWQVEAVCAANTVSIPAGGSFVTLNVSKQSTPLVYTIRLDEGNFYDSGGLHAGYSDNESYVYRILPPNGKKVSLDFESFETEKDVDILTIYDGPNTESPVLGVFSGTNKPGTITSRDGALTLRFSSDNRTNGAGWRASWSTSGLRPDTSIPTDPETPPVSTDDFKPELIYTDRSPETQPEIMPVYAPGSFKLSFNDISRGGRGLINQFYNIAQYSDGKWAANKDIGFLYDDFSGSFNKEWQSYGGSWKHSQGRLVQSDAALENTNLSMPMLQRQNDIYLYHWQAKMDGAGSNKRIGLHFFCSDLSKSNRGNSYFVWVREAGTGSRAEIYKTQNDQFYLQVQRSTKIEKGKVYDYKVIYNPSRGRIELYINDNFTVSWTDPRPLTQGKGISLRTGGCSAVWDNLIVYKARTNQVQVQVGTDPKSDIVLKGNKPEAFRVSSLVVDQGSNLKAVWSKFVQGSAEIKGATGGGTETDQPVDAGTPETPPSTPSSTGESGFLADSYSNDFTFSLPKPNTFILPADFNGKNWSANPNTGFFLDEFPGSTLGTHWVQSLGSWSQQDGLLIQKDESSTNSNLSAPLLQSGGDIYMYHWRTKILSKGDNKRFGLHFFADAGNSIHRGNSYLVWVRNYTGKQGKVEIYKSENNELLAPRIDASINIQDNVWIDCRVVYDAQSGLIEVYLNQSKVLSWRDPSPLRSGGFVSLRTGSAMVQFDDVRVYKLSADSNPQITVGTRTTDMIRYKSVGAKPGLRIYMVRMDERGRWEKVDWDEAIIR